MIVVAGGTGFIGSTIARALARRGERVAVLSHRRSPGTIHVDGLDLEIRNADVNDRGSLLRALAGADTIVGAAQFQGFPNENPGKGLTFEQVDKQGTENIVAAAKQSAVSRYVYISGAGAAPDSTYGWYRAKWGAETAVRGSGLGYLIVRPSWVFGRDDNALNRYVAFVRSPLPIVPVIGNGRQRLQPVFVEDVARLVADALGRGELPNAVYEIGGPQVLTMDEIIRAVEDVTGKRKPLLHQPARLVKALFSPKALVHALPLPLTPAAVDFATMDALADTGPLLAAFPDLRLTPLREALATYLEEGRSRATAGSAA
jgi:NADH dehydrogenase